MNFNSAISTSPKANNENDYLKLSDETPLGEWIEVRYLKEGMEIAVPDYSTNAIKWEKISSIAILEPQHVYDSSSFIFSAFNIHTKTGYLKPNEAK